MVWCCGAIAVLCQPFRNGGGRMAVIASCEGVYQVTTAPDLGLCIRRQASDGGRELAYEGLGYWPGREKLRYAHTPLGIGGIIQGVAIAKRGKGHRRQR